MWRRKKFNRKTEIGIVYCWLAREAQRTSLFFEKGMRKMKRKENGDERDTKMDFLDNQQKGDQIVSFSVE